MTQENKKESRPDSHILSPDEMGRLIRVTEPRVFLALGMGLLLIIGVVVWAIFGFIPSKVAGQGFLVPPGGVMDVVALGNGQITGIGLVQGQKVRQGQVVARLRMPDLENQKQSALTELTDARTWLQKRRDFFDRTVQVQEKNNADQIRYLGFRKKYLTEYFAFLKNHVKKMDTLRKSGSVTGKQLEETRTNMNSVMAQINDAELDIAKIQAAMIETKSQGELEILRAEERISKVLLQIENLDRSFEAMTRIVSPYDGIVVEILVERGDFVGPGSAIAVLKPLDPLLEAIILFPVQTGKKITPGMMVYVYPSTAGKEDYGCIYGLVAHISEYPVTPEGFTRIVGNSQMLDMAISQGEQMLWAKIALLRDTKTPSGFKWSSSKGPDRAIEAGTLAEAEVVTKYSRPLDLVFPKFSDMIFPKPSELPMNAEAQ